MPPLESNNQRRLPRVRADVPHADDYRARRPGVAPCAGGCSSAMSNIRPTYSHTTAPTLSPAPTPSVRAALGLDEEQLATIRRNLAMEPSVTGKRYAGLRPAG